MSPEKEGNMDDRHQVDRRTFFKTAGLGTFGLMALGADRRAEASSELPPEIHGALEHGVLKRTLGRTGLKVTAIGLGTIPTFRAPRAQAVKVIRKSIDLGINYIDTARAYRKGYSEERIGEALKGIRQNVVITSKTHTFDSGEGALKDVETSLKTMNTDYVDIYCFHELCQEKEWEQVIAPKGALEGFKRAKKDGKIRFIGISGHRSSQLTKIVESGEIDVVIIPYNYVFDDADADLWPTCAKLNIGMVAIKPFAGGFLNQHSLSLRWNLQKPPHVTVPGMWQVDEVTENTRHLREFLPVSETELAYLHEERQYWYYQLCRFCYQCQPCPQGIDYRTMVMMPLMLRRQGFEIVLVEGDNKLKYLNEMDKIDKCNKCQTCINTCPYHLPIPDLIQDVKRTYYGPVKYYRI
jgi:predicted aldo/keto reductase-like oxidoreductase